MKRQCLFQGKCYQLPLPTKRWHLWIIYSHFGQRSHSSTLIFTTKIWNWPDTSIIACEQIGYNPFASIWRCCSLSWFAWLVRSQCQMWFLDGSVANLKDCVSLKDSGTAKEPCNTQRIWRYKQKAIVITLAFVIPRLHIFVNSRVMWPESEDGTSISHDHLPGYWIRPAQRPMMLAKESPIPNDIIPAYKWSDLSKSKELPVNTLHVTFYQEPKYRTTELIHWELKVKINLITAQDEARMKFLSAWFRFHCNWGEWGRRCFWLTFFLYINVDTISQKVKAENLQVDIKTDNKILSFLQ